MRLLIALATLFQLTTVGTVVAQTATFSPADKVFVEFDPSPDHQFVDHYEFGVFATPTDTNPQVVQRIGKASCSLICREAVTTLPFPATGTIGPLYARILAVGPGGENEGWSDPTDSFSLRSLKPRRVPGKPKVLAVP